MTVISTYWIQKESKTAISYVDIAVLFLFPLIFFIYIFSFESIIDNFRTPISIGILLMIFNLTFLSNLKLFKNAIFLFLIIYGYSNLQYEKWQYYQFGNWREKNIILSMNKKNNTIDDNLNIREYYFIDTKLDTITIKSKKPYIFIATWNEYCKFCKVAFQDLIPILNTYTNFETYYVYDLKNYNPKSFLNSYNAENVLQNQNVIADYNYQFTTRLNLFADPSFLIINSENNKILFMSVGYSKTLKNSIIENLNKFELKNNTN